MTRPFDKLLVANRGEIARRIIRTAKRLGIHTIAVCSEADVDAPFATEADERHVIGPAAPKESYLAIDKILDVAKKTGAQAIHPGYGFLSENAGFARAVAAAGLTFVGPTPEAMEKVGGKLPARALARDAGVPLVPGTDAVSSLDDARAAAREIGYPILIKASAGGGGIGMSLVADEAQLERALEDAKKKGTTFFGNDTVYIEKLVEKPAHVEVQILADRHGNVVALGERDCTVQRRHQKVLEETPSPRLDDETRRAMLDAAVRIAKASGYENAGTVEMIFGGAGSTKGKFFFLEVNSRLQVEHPVTELVTGLDLVEWQLRIAAGEKLPDAVLNAPRHGASIEARICAEDPDKRFFPSPGTITLASFPEGPHVRVDAGVRTGSVVPPTYDSLLAKLVVHGATRAEAIARMKDAIAATKIEGVKTNLSLFPKVLDHATFVEGSHDTGFLKDQLGYKY
ncbi:ATP-grasp domain-containing protein [Myxococcota bacterium]|nr:ATP-grasp domain-containing protein [Myxococcota bacterium]